MISIAGKPIDFKHFNDGSCRVNIQPPPTSIVWIRWLYESDEEIVQLFYAANHLRAHHKEICLDMPYINSARQDRAINDDDVFTLKYFCDLINSLQFKRIRVYDPHSNVAAALLNNVEVEYPIQEIGNLLFKYSDACLVFPDCGAEHKYRKFFNVPFAFGVKERNWETQKIESLQLAGDTHCIAGHPILLCDDILSRGSTIYMAAKLLKERGATDIYVWVSHCENTVLGPHINGQSLLDIPNLITKVYTSNSIFTASHPKVEVLKIF